MTGTRRAQAYTLEGIIAAIFLLTAAVLAMQTVSLTPTTPGTIDAETRAQLEVQVADSLRAAHENGSLRATALSWNVSSDSFTDPYPDYGVNRQFGYGPTDPPTEFGAILNQTFYQRGYTYNVYLEYRNASDARTVREPLVVRGQPTDNAVTATHRVALFDDMQLRSPDPGRQLRDLDAGDFYATDTRAGPIYTVVTVRVVVW